MNISFTIVDYKLLVMRALAINGSDRNGTQVIEFLESLGGQNKHSERGNCIYCFYYINAHNEICSADKGEFLCTDWVFHNVQSLNELYPYRPGDIVKTTLGVLMKIQTMVWEDEQIFYGGIDLSRLRLDLTRIPVSLISGKYDGSIASETKDCPESDPHSDRSLAPKLISSDYSDRYGYTIPEGYEFLEVNYTSGREEILIRKKKPAYPETYTECCEVLGISDGEFMFTGLSDDEYDLFDSFVMIKRCRNAYWKMAGEQMELDKPWEPDWSDYSQDKFIITYFDNDEVLLTSHHHSYTMGAQNHILAFPTQEMMETFHKNFKELIEKCRSLL